MFFQLYVAWKKVKASLTDIAESQHKSLAAGSVNLKNRSDMEALQILLLSKLCLHCRTQIIQR